MGDLDLLNADLSDKDPAIFLVKKDSDEWLLIQYVPEKARVREKMLIAASKATLTKELGDEKFTDQMYASLKVISTVMYINWLI